MPDFSEYDSAYIAFDPFPSFKGSATHITEVYSTLRTLTSKTLLITLEGVLPALPDQWQPILSEGNYLHRGMEFCQHVKKNIENLEALRLIQFRDIWGGLAISHLDHITKIFEVNGFPSIELKERYPILPKKTISKIRILENQCLNTANEVICPSEVIADHLLSRGVSGRKIHVIPNGTNIPDSHASVDGLPEQYLVYFGALQPWQGINVAIKAFRYLADIPDVKLVICSSHKEKLSRPLKKFINNCGLEERVMWLHQLTKAELHFVVSKALISLAPLTECERNLIQGCSPLKIYESMGSQTAVIASDIPVVREILTHNITGYLVKPDRPADLARGIRRLLDSPQLRNEIALNAFNEVINKHSWTRSNNMLSSIYHPYFIPEPLLKFN